MPLYAVPDKAPACLCTFVSSISAPFGHFPKAHFWVTLTHDYGFPQLHFCRGQAFSN